MFQYNMIPTFKKATGVTRNTAAATVDDTITNTVICAIQHRFGIIKTDISDHFPIVFALNTREENTPENRAQFIYEWIYGEKQIELIKHKLNQVEWDNIIKTLGNLHTKVSSIWPFVNLGLGISALELDLEMELELELILQTSLFPVP